MVVEDEPLVRALVVEMLRQGRHRVFATGDPGEALRELEAGRACDLLVTDLLLPTLSGRELVDEARARRPKTRALFISGFPKAHAELRSDGPAEGFIEK